MKPDGIAQRIVVAIIIATIIIRQIHDQQLQEKPVLFKGVP